MPCHASSSSTRYSETVPSAVLQKAHWDRQQPKCNKGLPDCSTQGSASHGSCQEDVSHRSNQKAVLDGDARAQCSKEQSGADKLQAEHSRVQSSQHMPGERDLQAEELLHSSSDQSSYAYWYADSRAFNPFRDVVVRLETVGEKQVRVIVVVVRSTVALAVVLLALETALKYLKDNDWWLRSRAPQLWNLVLGAICLAASCSMLLHLVARLIGVRRAGKRWTRRRKYIVTLHTMELAAQGVNNLMWVTANAYVYAGKCRWFDPLVHWCAFISWTCWNTILLIFITEAHANNPWRHRVWQKRRSGSDRGPQAGHDHQPHHHQADEKSMVRDSAQPQQANADVDSVSWESDQPQPKRDVDEDSVFWDSQPPQSKQGEDAHRLFLDPQQLQQWKQDAGEGSVFRDSKQPQQQPKQNVDQGSVFRDSQQPQSKRGADVHRLFLDSQQPQQWKQDADGDSVFRDPQQPQQQSKQDVDQGSVFRDSQQPQPQPQAKQNDSQKSVHRGADQRPCRQDAADYHPQGVSEQQHSKQALPQQIQDQCGPSRQQHPVRLDDDQQLWAQQQQKHHHHHQRPRHQHNAAVHQTVMDAPTTHHLPKFVVWGAFEAINIAVLVLHTGRYESVQALRNEQLANAPRCEAQAYSCRLDGLSLRLIAALMGIFFLYQAIWVWYMVRAFQLLRRMPYADYKLANIHLAIELRTRLYTIAVFFVSLLLLFWLRFNSCASYIQSWLGFGPLMMVATTLSVTQCYMFEPKDPDLALPVLTVWLQDFAWTEEDKPRKLAARLAMLPICPAILDEPLFCFETAVKMFYWSALVYRYQEPPPGHHPHMSTDTALRMYSLQHLQCFWEKKEDTKVLVGWSDSLVVLAFRGTASLANVLADIQMWRSPYPPGKQSCCVRPLVHSGFKRSWLANGLRDKVCQHVADITRAAACARRDVQVIVTGHSLGGALATLAAFDIMRGCPWLSKKAVSCYTFGAPRTGNHAFAAEYNATVPDTWHVINDQDAVARGGKFVWLYKRPGQRVLIDAAGNIVVRPVFVELTVQQLPLRRSIGQHMLVAYQRSLLAICGAHLNSKRWRPVMQAFERILEQVAAHTAPSREEDEDLEALERLGRFGLLAAAVGGKVHRGFNEVRNQLDPGANGSAAPDIEDGRRASPREGQGSGGLADIRVDDAAAPDEPSSPPGHLHFRELPWQPPHVQGLSDPSPTALPGSLSSGSSLSSSSDPPHTPGTLYGFLAQLRDQGELTPEIIHLPMPPRTDRQREGVGPPVPSLEPSPGQPSSPAGSFSLQRVRKLLPSLPRHHPKAEQCADGSVGADKSAAGNAAQLAAEPQDKPQRAQQEKGADHSVSAATSAAGTAGELVDGPQHEEA